MYGIHGCTQKSRNSEVLPPSLSSAAGRSPLCGVAVGDDGELGTNATFHLLFAPSRTFPLSPLLSTY